MSNRLLIGNLSLDATETYLEELFSHAGRVRSIELVADPTTKKRKGFAFIEMSSIVEAEKAVELLDGAEVDKRAITVNLSELSGQKSGFSFVARCLKLLQARG